MDHLVSEVKERIFLELGEEIESIRVERAVLGLFFTGVKLSTGEGGLSFTPVKEMPEAVCCPSSAKAMPLSGKLSGKPVIEYLHDLDNGNPLRRALAFACLNALSTRVFERYPDRYKIERGIDAFDRILPAEGDFTVVVGALIPMLKKLRGKDYAVVEMDSRTLKGEELEHFVPWDEAGKTISAADILVVTGVSILNGTLSTILDLMKEGATVLVTGPTASMLPESFFARGVTMMGGILVTEPDPLLDLLAEGGSGYHFFGKYADRTLIHL